jgi:hypothetical protein
VPTLTCPLCHKSVGPKDDQRSGWVHCTNCDMQFKPSSANQRSGPPPLPIRSQSSPGPRRRNRSSASPLAGVVVVGTIVGGVVGAVVLVGLLLVPSKPSPPYTYEELVNLVRGKTAAEVAAVLGPAESFDSSGGVPNGPMVYPDLLRDANGKIWNAYLTFQKQEGYDQEPPRSAGGVFAIARDIWEEWRRQRYVR